MRHVCLLSLVLGLSSLCAAPAIAADKVIDFPCLKNLADGRVLVDGPQWDAKMRSLGYDLADGAYVPWEVLSFTRHEIHDAIWAEGLCRLKLLPVEK